MNYKTMYMINVKDFIEYYNFVIKSNYVYCMC